MKYPLLLALFSVGVLLFAGFYFVSRILYKSRHKENYHFYRMFPYEFNYPAVFKENMWGNIIFILASFAMVAFYILNPYESVYKTIAIVISIVFTMISLCLLLMPLRYLRTHLVLSVVGMTLPLALALFNLFLAHTEYKATNEAICIVSMVVSGILTLIMLVLILNPKLTFKIYLDKTVDDSGKEVLKRPRVIFLALNEWVSIFVYFLTPLSILLISFVI